MRGTGPTGYRLAKAAFELDDGIDLELAAENLVVAIFGLGEPAAAAGERLVGGAAARSSSGSARTRPERPQEPLAPPPPWGELAMTPREAFLGPQEVVPFDQAAGRSPPSRWPPTRPGIPNVLPGERLTRETLDYIAESVGHGGHVRGGSDRAAEDAARHPLGLQRAMATFDRLADLPLEIEGYELRGAASCRHPGSNGSRP